MGSDEVVELVGAVAPESLRRFWGGLSFIVAAAMILMGDEKEGYERNKVFTK